MILEIIQKSIFISSIVLMLMIIIEFLFLISYGKLNTWLFKRKFFQIIISSILGISPGCAGTFAVVNFYTHGVFSFPALLAALIATFGDEAYVIFSVSPLTGLKISVILLILSFFIPLMLLFISKKKYRIEPKDSHYSTHENEECCLEIKDFRFSKIQCFSLQKILFIVILLLILIISFFHNHNESNLSFEFVFYLITSLITLYILLVVPEHFITEHLWEHIIKKHFVKLIFWTVAIISFIGIIQYFIPENTIKNIMEGQYFYLLIGSIVIGFFPVSGPNLIFFNLYISGLIPFVILLTNSIVQDGHAGIPLLAENKKIFFIVKFYKTIIALFIGIIYKYLIL